MAEPVMVSTRPKRKVETMEPSVVVGYDQSPSSELALDVAAAEAAWRGAELIVVHAFHRMTDVAGSPHELPSGDPRQAAALRIAEHGAERIGSRHLDLTVHPRAVVGFAPAVLAQASVDAELLVVGHRGHGGFAGLNLGSVALRSVTHAVCPVVVVRGSDHPPRGLVVAAVDIDDGADEVLDFAFAEADRRKVRLKVVSTLEILWPFAYAGDSGQLHHAEDEALERADMVLGELLHSRQVKYPDVAVEHELVQGSPTAVLDAATKDADLIVAGARRRAHGHQGLLVGPTATPLLQHADCMVAVVPHD